jgi:hypothetical protein
MLMDPEEKKRLRREETRDSAAALIEDLALFRECPTSAPMRQIWRLEEGRISGSS